ncbi:MULTISPECIES: class I SAM-dependent methyltransferase [unclassified Janthinobacterium]|uniref:class I SAM-dependent methyltransferase n=1 Tax=unclassified Janthinobacterium TaxID=2610881 RepID=UPI00034A41E5|nr:MULTISPECIES: class I SAM-dependent methyltransferase [unclassified Janthinobacterium]MEC5162316.1 SAM-dependent methyltransferase [Janthinobacterium sp. CG_S6]
MSLPRQLWRAPAVRAALLQALAFPLMLSLVYLLARAGLPPPMVGVALLQGALAAALSWRCGLASWWRAIQLLFPLALLAAQSLHLPPLLFLLAFLFLLGLYWSTFRTQVPFYPSGPAVWDAVARLLPSQRPARLIDIGSGLGGLVLELARRRPDCVFTGIELAPLPWLLSVLRARLGGSAARFVRGDYERLDFGNYDAVFAYLSPAAMAALWEKAAREMRPGTMLFSYEFNIAAQKPDRSIAATPGGPALYVWYF